ncbi:MAG: GTPase ObgE [Planctomycetota bacterium]
MFIDHAIIKVRAGNGGHGCVSFRREKYVPRGGPNGGDGGKGGDLIIVGNPQVATLLDFNRLPEYAAGNGKPGSGSNKTGRAGGDLVLQVPLGTTLFDETTGLQLRDITEEGEPIVVARGGRGGRGNARFKSSINQTPREFEKGAEGESRALRLELRLIADAGIVGLPNAGKSTLLGKVSAARPKVSGYPFTTLAPNLGIVELDDYTRLVLADMPGLIEGAHDGKGLGDEFLRHVERTRMLVHLVDVSPAADTDPVEAYETLREEIRLYSPALAGRPFVVAANKLDMEGAEANARRLEDRAGRHVVRISALTGTGLKTLLWKINEMLTDAE